MSFFDEFNHIVPYSIRVNVGRNKQFKKDANKKSFLNHKGKLVAFYKKPKTREESIIDKGMDEKTLRKNILEAFEKMNDDFIFIEPKLIPIIPGDDPAVINEVSEFSEDNY